MIGSAIDLIAVHLFHYQALHNRCYVVWLCLTHVYLEDHILINITKIFVYRIGLTIQICQCEQNVYSIKNP